VVLGYRVDNIIDVYQGLESISIPAINYAVFEGGFESETFIPDYAIDHLLRADMPAK